MALLRFSIAKRRSKILSSGKLTELVGSVSDSALDLGQVRVGFTFNSDKKYLTIDNYSKYTAKCKGFHISVSITSYSNERLSSIIDRPRMPTISYC